MTAVGIYLAGLWGITLFVSYKCTNDLFSPDKFFLAILAFFFADIFFHDYPLHIVLIYGVLILCVLFSVIVFCSVCKYHVAEVRGIKPQGRPVEYSKFLFWALSFPALLANLYLIQSFGGISGYINRIALKEVEFQGLGPLTTIARTFSIINLVYFAFFLRSHKSRSGKFWFWTHFLIFVFTAVLTASRGSLLINFVLMGVIYHYLWRKIKVRFMATLVIVLFTLATAIEIAREGVKFEDGKLVTGFAYQDDNSSSSGFGWAKYGLTSLELVTNAEYVKPYYGTTYLTVFTNFIPRAIWPEKPDPGGVILTKEYTDNAWNGSSYLSTGIVPEAVINFGQTLGIIIGLLLFFMLVLSMMVYYHNYKAHLVSSDTNILFITVRYSFIMWAGIGLVVGEFTNVMMDIIVKLVVLLTLEFIIRIITFKSYLKRNGNNRWD